jgi:hypothetical protein
MTTLTKQQRRKLAWKRYLEIKQPAWKKYLKIKESALKKYEGIRQHAWKEYRGERKRIAEEEVTEIIHNGKKYRLVEE